MAIGEGEQTMLEIVNAFKAGDDFSKINGIAYKKASLNGRQKSDSDGKAVRPARSTTAVTS